MNKQTLVLLVVGCLVVCHGSTGRAEKVRVTIRIKGPVSKVRSVALDQDLQVESGAETITVTLPRLDEGDVLLLE